MTRKRSGTRPAALATLGAARGPRSSARAGHGRATTRKDRTEGSAASAVRGRGGPDLLTQVAGADGPGQRPVRLTGHRPHSADDARRLSRTIGYLRDHVLADPDSADQPLVASTAAQHLAASVLAAFPNTMSEAVPGPDGTDTRPAMLRRAPAYIDDHAGEPVTVADIAGAARVTVRALQYAFRRHLDTTPLAQLRRVRLAHAHHDLLAADPSDGATVTEIAARWGFYHPGRFASLYRDTYRRAPRLALAGE